MPNKFISKNNVKQKVFSAIKQVQRKFKAIDILLKFKVCLKYVITIIYSREVGSLHTCMSKDRKRILLHQTKNCNKIILSRSITLITKPCDNKQIITRTMMSGRSFYVARAAYHSLTAISNNDVMTYTTSNNNSILIENLVDLSLNHNTGVIQHKSAFIRHMINHKFDGQIMYNLFCKKTHINNIKCVPGDTDSRVINEFPVIQAYYEQFNKKIIHIQANLDNHVGNFYAQKQTNQDFFVNILTAYDNATTPNILRPHDEKSGMGMFKHATRGTIGLLTYDAETEHNVQIMSHTVEMAKLIDKDLEHLNGVSDGLVYDSMFTKNNERLLIDARNILNNAGNSFLERLQTHKTYQQFMWDNFHTNPNYPRSISFIFPVVVEYNHSTEQDPRFINFKNNFISILGDKTYDLNKRGDCKDISKAMLVAYKDTVDVKIIEKIQHLQHTANITFNAKFLEDLASMIKHNLI